MASRALMAMVLLALAAPAAAQDAGPTIVDAPYVLGAPEVSAVASPTAVRLGEPFVLFVTATFGGDVRVNLPEPLALGAASASPPTTRPARTSSATPPSSAPPSPARWRPGWPRSTS
jgi:hypothetical protein